MTLTHILVFVAAALLYLLVLPARWRPWALFAGSIIAIYWLQPPVRIDTLDFLFPTATLILVTLSWRMTRAPAQGWTREDILSGSLMAALIIGLSLTRYLIEDLRITPSRPPEPLPIVIVLAGFAGLLLLMERWQSENKRTLVPSMIAVVAIFIVLKTGPLAEQIARWLRDWQGQPTSLAKASELEWLGFSYVAFRLLHTLRDRQTGKLPALNLREYVTYTIFFPSFTAGPIDRAERFLPELRNLPGPQPDSLTQGGMRITVGIAKKFVIADTLAYFALNATKAEQATSPGGLWVLLYAYAFQLYFDFSGYSDIAIGIGQPYGIKPPENFAQPYVKRNITQFWQSWHITLSNWVRFYVFSPLSRYLLMRKPRPSPTALALVGQMTTMIVIGLWHGVAWNFVIWGIWHGVGLFVHKLWSDRTRKWYMTLRDQPQLSQAVGAIGMLLTFHYVILGWVWFALPDVSVAWNVFTRLWGG